MKRAAKARRAAISGSVATVLMDRLEEAILTGVLPATRDGEITIDYAVLLAVLFPEEHPAPKPIPAEPTHTPPESKARADAYRDRRQRGESLWHPADLDAIADDRYELFGRVLANGRGHRMDSVQRREAAADDAEDGRVAAVWDA